MQVLSGIWLMTLFRPVAFFQRALHLLCGVAFEIQSCQNGPRALPRCLGAPLHLSVSSTGMGVSRGWLFSRLFSDSPRVSLRLVSQGQEVLGPSSCFLTTPPQSRCAHLISGQSQAVRVRGDGASLHLVVFCMHLSPSDNYLKLIR